MSKRKGYCRDSAVKRIARRDGMQCRACSAVPLRWEWPSNGTTSEGYRYSAVEPRVLLHLDHVTPLADGGRSEDANFQLLCPPCHDAKTAGENLARRIAA